MQLASITMAIEGPQPCFHTHSTAFSRWMVMRMQSSFLVKRESGRIQFSSEKYNLTSQNSFKYQGIANDKAVDISQVRTASPSSLPRAGIPGRYDAH